MLLLKTSLNKNRMNRIGFILIGAMLSLSAFTQAEKIENQYKNTADNKLDNNSKLSIGGYGEVHYNQPLNSETRNNGTLDVHRIVMLFGYQFNERTQFITELEFEHVKEVYVEQAFLQYKLNDFINLRGGLLLVPMGIINEYHEPTAFNGVERPLVDKYIAPTTWREVGFGASGNVIDASIKYQLYVVNGFASYNGSATLSGSNGLRKGRQKGAESFISAPNFTGKVEYYGIKGLNLGISGYFGKTQSTLYDGIDKNDKTLNASADSSVVGVTMIGVDARYTIKGLTFKGQYYLSNLSNTEQYNQFTATNGTLNDLGSSMSGYYIEAGYNLFKSFLNLESELIPFIRYEQYNTHKSTEGIQVANPAYNNTLITTGLTWKITPGTVVKADLQFFKSEADEKYSPVLNTGFGVMF